MHEISAFSPLPIASNATPTRVVRADQASSFRRHVGEEKAAENGERASTNDTAASGIGKKPVATSDDATIHEQAPTPALAGLPPMNAQAGLLAALPLPILPESLAGCDAQLYAQSLQVIGYLSMLGEHGNHPSALRSVDAQSDIQSVGTDSGGDSINVEGSSVSPGSIRLDAETAVSATPVMQGLPYGERNRDGDFAAVVESVGALPAATDVAKRLVRLTGDPRSATLWVRDYRMSAEQSIAVAREAYRQAQDSGGGIARVVVNGHEVWRAVAADTTNTKGKSDGG